MMITIHGFPAKTKFQDVKMLIKQECNIDDFILDNLVNDADGTKKVRIGLADNTEGFKVMKCLDGYRMPGNFILKAVPIGKTSSNQPAQESGYNPRSNYQNQTRNDYMSQAPNDYGNQSSHGAPLNHGGMHGAVGPHGPRPMQGGGLNHGSMDRPSPWASGNSNNSNQWNTPMVSQVPQNTFGFTAPQGNVNPNYVQQPHQTHPRAGFNQGRAPEHGFGFTPKAVPELVPHARVEARHALRSIETVDTNVTHPPIHGRYPASQPYQQDKPHTIMKDNFQGPTSYNITNPGGQSGSHSGPGVHQSQYSSSVPSPWQSQSQPSKTPLLPYDKQYDDRKYIQPDARDPKAQPKRIEPEERTYKEYEKRRGFSPRRSPIGRRPSPEHVRRVSPSGRRHSPSGRHLSPSGRRISPSGRRVSPSARRVSPLGRKLSPSGRRISPHARKFSPTGKRTSPDRRMPVHQAASHLPIRRDSPHKRPSPLRRLVSPMRRPSPGRRDDPQRIPRYSPERHPSEKLDKYGQDKLKQVRPAYEPTAHASNQAMYSGGYRPNNRETGQYSMQGMRKPETRISPWARDREEPAVPIKKQDDDRRDMARMQMRDRMPDAAVDAKRTKTSQRSPRSPVQRDRSPLRDRYKRHSPSPSSSHSPRRSWALDKRRSPEIHDAPPPPSWPGQNVRAADFSRTRSNFPEREAEKTKHVPVWEPRAIDEEPRGRRPEISERRPFVEDKIRPVKEIPVREPVAHAERFVQREPKFKPREEYDVERHDKYHRREPSVERKPLSQHPHREEYDPARRARELEDRPHPDEYHRRRESPPRHDTRTEELVKPPIDKDFEDIYKRALLFKKKAEEIRKVGSKRRDDYLEEAGSSSRQSERDHGERGHRHEDRHRIREEELRTREREDRPRDDAPRRDYRRDDNPMEGDAMEDTRFNHFKMMSLSVRSKRDKAITEICDKILDKHENCRQLQGHQRNRVLEELKLAIARIVHDMFGNSDVSFIEIIIKYQAKYNLKEEEKILQQVMSSLPSQLRVIKRQAPEISEVPAKSRRSQSPHMKPEHAQRPKLSDSRWTVNVVPPEVVTMPMLGQPPVLPPAMNPAMVPVMVPAPFIHPYETQNAGFMSEQFQQPQPQYQQPQPQFQQPQPQFQQPQPQFQQPQPQFQQPPHQSEVQDEAYKVYLCKDDFEQITGFQADALKSFLISQMLRETEVSQGWAPDFTLKGLQSSHRYELITKDDSTLNWLVNLDFSGFTEFNVIAYTKEELWYERAAVWLPGHSRSRNIEPLDKLKMQNRHLEGINIAKWKFVKKIVTQKGTRLYVDMPPSAARALEQQKLLLSYELQKVNVFLKAVAVDKDVFDSGLKERTTVDPSLITDAIKNSPMPSLAYNPAIIKITLKGCKSLTLVQARKIKEVLIHLIYRHYQYDGTSRTDFLRYGFLPPNYFGVVPENPETKKWLLGQYLGKVDRQVVVVLGAEDEMIQFFKMYVIVPHEYQHPAGVAERLKQSNQGVKGINFNIWKPIKITIKRNHKLRYDVHVDLGSLETLTRMNYQLDYVDAMNTTHIAKFKSEKFSYTQLEQRIEKCKAEMTDCYDIANMDLDSDSDDDIICLD